MIQDLGEIAPGTVIAADICIVGGGAAGLTLAKEFVGSGLKVCLIESGGLEDEADTQSIYQGESIGHAVVMDEGRYRVLGGSATKWGGRCALFDEIDFEPRDWIPRSGWPITKETLLPYYARAQRMCRFPEPWSQHSEAAKVAEWPLPKLQSPDVEPFVWRYALVSYHKNFNWSEQFRDLLAADSDTRIVLHANLTSFEVADDGSTIHSITAASLNGRTVEIEAKRFILCCGGIENVRLLMNAPDAMLRKVNEFDQLGRYFAQHPRGCVATVRANSHNSRRLQSLFNIFWKRKQDASTYEIGFALSESAQRERKLVNASAAINYILSDESPWKSVERLRDAFRSRQVKIDLFHEIVNALRGSKFIVMNFFRRVLWDQPAILPEPVIRVIVDLEQVPDPDSRVTLSCEKDPFGMYRAKVDWKIAQIERDTAKYLGELVATELDRLGYGKSDLSAWLNSDKPLSDQDLYGTYHHIGTTRMADDPRRGVVDSNCKSHGVKNLYLAGCSVFPTGGHANPTLTIVALAIRMADHLKQELAMLEQS